MHRPLSLQLNLIERVLFLFYNFFTEYYGGLYIFIINKLISNLISMFDLNSTDFSLSINQANLKELSHINKITNWITFNPTVLLHT